MRLRLLTVLARNPDEVAVQGLGKNTGVVPGLGIDDRSLAVAARNQHFRAARASKRYAAKERP